MEILQVLLEKQVDLAKTEHLATQSQLLLNMSKDKNYQTQQQYLVVPLFYVQMMEV